MQGPARYAVLSKTPKATAMSLSTNRLRVQFHVLLIVVVVLPRFANNKYQAVFDLGLIPSLKWLATELGE